VSILEGLARIQGLNEVERLVQQSMVSDASSLTAIAQYLHGLGGKRIRPLLCLTLAAVAGVQEPTEELVTVAAGIELIHLATLLHDDIIDGSPLRRHQPSPLAVYGIPKTLLTGDFLLVRAFGLCAMLPRYVIQATERACVELTEGEVLEEPLFVVSHTLESSLAVARKKTASLFSLATESAAYLCSLPSPTVEQLRLFGEELGIAFQMLDDILDVTSNEKELGKRPGTDLLERKPSLVNLLWLESSKSSSLSRRLFEPPGTPEEELPWMTASLEEIVNGGIVDEARSRAKSRADSALAYLSEAFTSMPSADAEAYRLLQQLAEFVIQRVS
jgi:octaprenyl-diphosphate synthase